MSDATRALVQEMLDRAHLSRRRAAVRHGIPGGDEPRNVVKASGDATAATAALTDRSAADVLAELQAGREQPAASSKWRKYLVPALLATTGLGGAGAAAGLAYSLATAGQQHTPPSATKPAGDLLEWLDQKGYSKP